MPGGKTRSGKEQKPRQDTIPGEKVAISALAEVCIDSVTVVGLAPVLKIQLRY
jgi:hypothetical protein